MINKPAGVVVHEDAHHLEKESVAGWFIKRYGKELVRVGQRERPGVVHRLDKPTSGVMVLVKTPRAYRELVSQFKQRQVKKEYLALVWGDVKKRVVRHAALHEPDRQRRAVGNTFIIDAPVARHPQGGPKFVVREGGKRARTRFKILGALSREISSSKQKQKIFRFTLLKAFPETGRTHQIRVHLKALGHPVVGDRLYQTRKQNQVFEEELVKKQSLPGKEGRMFLHALKLGFRVPPEGKWLLFYAPPPKEFTEVMTSLTDQN